MEVSFGVLEELLDWKPNSDHILQEAQDYKLAQMNYKDISDYLKDLISSEMFPI